MNAASNTRPDRLLNNVQGLRAIAAMMVVFAHQPAFLKVIGIPPTGIGGVDLFFVISGFIMVYTSADRHASDFARDRIARIVPIYWLLTGAVFAVAILAPALVKGTSASLADLGMSVLFIPFEKPSGAMQPVLFVGWTLNYEMFFYALFTLGLCFRNRSVGLLFTACALFTLVVIGQILQLGSIAAFYADPIILEFTFGMGIGVAARELPKNLAHWVTVPLIISAGAMIIFLFWLPLALPSAPRVISMGLPAAGLVAASVVLEQYGSRVRWRPAIYIGGASYSIYLIHPFVTETAQRLFRPVGPPLAALCIVATMVTVAVCGGACWRHLEQPLTRWAKRLVHRLAPHVDNGNMAEDQTLKIISKGPPATHQSAAD